jgi:hypothetical protein
VLTGPTGKGDRSASVCTSKDWTKHTVAETAGSKIVTCTATRKATGVDLDELSAICDSFTLAK